MKKFLILLIFAYIVIFVTSCVSPYAIAEGGRTVNLTIDEQFKIELEGNASTGYIWQVMPFDTTVIQQVGEPEFKSKDGRIGAGGKITFTFRAIADGHTDLSLVYHRRWEKDQPPAKKFEMKLVVGKTGRKVKD